MIKNKVDTQYSFKWSIIRFIECLAYILCNGEVVAQCLQVGWNQLI